MDGAQMEARKASSKQPPRVVWPPVPVQEMLPQWLGVWGPSSHTTAPGPPQRLSWKGGVIPPERSLRGSAGSRAAAPAVPTSGPAPRHDWPADRKAANPGCQRAAGVQSRHTWGSEIPPRGAARRVLLTQRSIYIHRLCLLINEFAFICIINIIWPVN